MRGSIVKFTVLLTLSALASSDPDLDHAALDSKADGAWGLCSSFTECLGLANLRARGRSDADRRLASALFMRAAAMRPGSKQAWLGLGASRQDLQDLHGAEAALTEAMAIDPLCWRVGINIGHRKHPPLTSVHGMFLVRWMRLDESCLTLFTLPSSSSVAALRGDYGLSARAFEHVLRGRPNTPQALYSLGFLRMLEVCTSTLAPSLSFYLFLFQISK